MEIGPSGHLRRNALSVLEIEADRHRRPGGQRARAFDVGPELERGLGFAIIQGVDDEQFLVDRFDRPFMFAHTRSP